MQQERNYRYAPTFSGDAYGNRRSQPVMEMNPCQNNCGCEGNENGGMGCEGGGENMVLAMAYVLSQPFEKLYSAEDAIKRGTLFMALDLPYGGKRQW